MILRICQHVNYVLYAADFLLTSSITQIKLYAFIESCLYPFIHIKLHSSFIRPFIHHPFIYSFIHYHIHSLFLDAEERGQLFEWRFNFSIGCSAMQLSLAVQSTCQTSAERPAAGISGKKYEILRRWKRARTTFEMLDANIVDAVVSTKCKLMENN